MRKVSLTSIFSFVLIFAFLLSGCGKSGPTWEEVGTQTSYLSTQWDQLKPRIQNAMTEENANVGKYPPRYTQELYDDKLRAMDALQVLGDENSGWIHDLKVIVHDEENVHDIQEALDLIGRIQPVIQQAVAYPNRVLGLPGKPQEGLFKVLAKKVKLFNEGYDPGDGKNLYDEVNEFGPTVLEAIANAKESGTFTLCGSKVQMTFSYASAQYVSALTELATAEKLVKEGDFPAASDKLASAYGMYSTAKDFVAARPGQEKSGALVAHGNVTGAIAAANTAKENADKERSSFWNIGAYYKDDSDREYNNGQNNLKSAVEQCQTENFDGAVNFANNAKSNFEESERLIKESAPDTTPIVSNSSNQEETNNKTEEQSDDIIIPEIVINDVPDTEVYNDAPDIEIFDDAPETEIYEDAPETDIFQDGDSWIPLFVFQPKINFSILEVWDDHIA